jgi:hypothetical protein
MTYFLTVKHSIIYEWLYNLTLLETSALGVNSAHFFSLKHVPKRVFIIDSDLLSFSTQSAASGVLYHC